MIRFFKLSVLILICNTAAAQTIDEEFENLLIDYDMMGMSAIVSCNNEIIFAGNYGLANYNLNTPVTAETKYRIASVSKTITAIAFMQLVENGWVNLDDNIGDILGYEITNPNFPLISITPRMLLSHTSSIQDGTGYSTFLTDTYSDNMPSIDELITSSGNYFTTNIFSPNQPGSYFAYSNLNYGIIGSLIEKISQQRFDIYVKENILIPLEIDGSFNVQDISSLENLAVLYRKQSNIWTPQTDNYGGEFPDPIDLENYVFGANGLLFSPQGGLRISAIDLSKIMGLLSNHGTYNNVVMLDSATVAAMQNTEWIFNGSNGDNYGGLFQSWGLGLHKLTNTPNDDIIYENQNMIGHAGEAYGLVSDMFYQQEGNFGIIFITNGIGQSYEYGNQSDFYIVEEDVFEILFDSEVASCLTNTALNENENFEVSIFPNPSSSFVNVMVSKNNKLKIDIFNSLGKLVLSDLKINANGLLKINTTKLSTGMYRINFYDGSQNYSKLFHVE
jgi:CubicO group peptidase (beta-lactamase class C family)